MENKKKNLISRFVFYFLGCKFNFSHIAVLVIVIFLLSFIGFSIFWPFLEREREIVIEEGQSLNFIADVLKNEGVIRNKLIFIFYVLITGNEKKLQAGRYFFEPGINVFGVVQSMTKGFSESEDVVLTIPEGFNVFDIDERLFSFGLIKKGEFAKKYFADEGQFFPDTYHFKRPDSLSEGKNETADSAGSPQADSTTSTSSGQASSLQVDSIAEKIKNHFNLKLKDSIVVLSPLVFQDTLVRASILEKEARNEEDMRLVAGVIENRLERGMLLQIDATVSYGACLKKLKDSTYKYCDVSQVPVGEEIKNDSPYNSYTRPGLPPGPIANPGIQAIKAVLNPQKSDYLYYLSTRDGSRIIFSKTANEHAANRRKYLGL
ncbi:MAG: hypothetical protein COV30_01835 [Candidatus Yanofskybacteria bacterium CG10_big_fil_rev_8_21_14_0_10_37_15]|uniref:Endolytic murein transglycosylase n=1 Tax=Candidatus Yanofskybacteria bacterium CG10_big_fil_rev_8_21_14_0_10_37_15 TaxID=1975097 RepID=A0A2H0R5K5_9BACT|nr:MAG: hypothetical protein COV30_01835 [Candidatus Yanofskybacteria bacterium CG10_big_fil_rev_8_21_14_0_10_37_15]